MRSACVNGPLAAFLVLVIYVAWCRIAYMGATENAGVENAGVNRMERQPEIIIIEKAYSYVVRLVIILLAEESVLVVAIKIVA